MPQTPRGEHKLSGRGFKKHVANPKHYSYNKYLNLGQFLFHVLRYTFSHKIFIYNFFISKSIL